jgi:hypothetical protein
MKHRRLSLWLQMSRFFTSPSLYLVLLIAFSCFLGGCASTQKTTAAFTPVTFESSKAVIYIYRKSRFVGAANNAEIYINEQHVGKLVNGSYCTHVTDPGPIEIKALENVTISLNIISRLLGKQPLIEFTADPGREYFLEFNVAGYKVKQVAKDKALGVMKGLKPAKSSAE